MFALFLIKAILLVLNYIIIHNFTVCHSFLFLQLFYFIEIVNLLAKENSLYKSITLLIISFINIFFILLFLEFIEINIFKISYNTKKILKVEHLMIKNFMQLMMEKMMKKKK